METCDCWYIQCNALQYCQNRVSIPLVVLLVGWRNVGNAKKQEPTVNFWRRPSGRWACCGVSPPLVPRLNHCATETRLDGADAAFRDYRKSRNHAETEFNDTCAVTITIADGKSNNLFDFPWNMPCFSASLYFFRKVLNKSAAWLPFFL